MVADPHLTSGAEPKLPKHLRKRPRYGAHVVPYIVSWAEGRPDFRVTDVAKWQEVLLHRLCALCGHKLRTGGWFIGGPRSIDNRLFFDPPMHRECAVYALQVCPFLALSREYSTRPVHVPNAEISVVKVMAPTRPEKFGLAHALNYHLVDVHGETVIQAAPWTAEVEWWKDGERLHD